MATATELTTRALRRLGVLDPLQAAAAEDIQTGTEALNAMIASWETDGLSGDVLPLDARHEAGVVAMLAVRLAEEYGKSPGPVLLRDARDGWTALQAAYMPIPESVFDMGLRQPGAGYVYEQDTAPDAQVPAWEANRSYLLRSTVISNGALYECITAGTSGSTAPAGTFAIIVDGTCEWCFRRVVV